MLAAIMPGKSTQALKHLNPTVFRDVYLKFKNQFLRDILAELQASFLT